LEVEFGKEVNGLEMGGEGIEELTGKGGRGVLGHHLCGIFLIIVW
jgi:hypothetical protein